MAMFFGCSSCCTEDRGEEIETGHGAHRPPGVGTKSIWEEGEEAKPLEVGLLNTTGSICQNEHNALDALRVEAPDLGGASPDECIDLDDGIDEGCCSNKEELQTEKAGDREQDDVKVEGDMQVKLALREAKEKLAKEKREKKAKAKAAEEEKALEKDLAKQAAEKLAEKLKEADAAFRSSQWDVAVLAYSEAIGIDARSSRARAGRGGAYLRQELFQEALQDLNEALALDDSNLYALRDRAEARHKLGDLEGAAADYDKKLSLAGGDGRALCGRGEVKMKQGDKDGALEYFQLAMQLNYKGSDVLFRSAKAER